MPRPQFSLKSLLWLMAVVAAFAAGAKLESMRNEVVIGPAVYVNVDGTPTARGSHRILQHAVLQKYPWLDYLPAGRSRRSQ